MLIHEFLPAVSKYTDSIADSILKRRQVSDIPTESDETRMRKLVAGYEELSSLCDELKEEMPSEFIPYPTYADMLFYV
jgi:hypothetical protein